MATWTWRPLCRWCLRPRTKLRGTRPICEPAPTCSPFPPAHGSTPFPSQIGSSPPYVSPGMVCLASRRGRVMTRLQHGQIHRLHPVYSTLALSISRFQNGQPHLLGLLPSQTPMLLSRLRPVGGPAALSFLCRLMIWHLLSCLTPLQAASTRLCLSRRQRSERTM